MIESVEQYQQAREAIERLERSLLALRARVFGANEQLFYAMAEDYRSNIEAIRADIDAYTGLQALRNRDASLWMVLDGQSISREHISSRILADWLNKFRKSLYGVASYLQSGTLRLGGRPDSLMLDATDPYLAVLAPGSIRLGLRLPSVELQSDMFVYAEDEVPISHRALQQMLNVAAWANSNEIVPPLSAYPDLDTLTVAARFAAQLAPSQRSEVRSVTFSGAMLNDAPPLRLTSETKARLIGLVGVLSREAVETVRGLVREIDLDQRRIILRERGGGLSDLKCFVPADQMGKAEQLLNKQVVVVGLVSSATPDTMSIQTIDPDIDLSP